MFSLEPTRLRATQDQFLVLLQFMEEHGDLGNYVKTPLDRIKTNRLWMKLAKMLNKVKGGVKKPTVRWKRVWADWKTKTKRKAAHLVPPARFGPKLSKVVGLKSVEKRLLAVITANARKTNDNSDKLQTPEEEVSDNDPLPRDPEDSPKYLLLEPIVKEEEDSAPEAVFEVPLTHSPDQGPAQEAPEAGHVDESSRPPSDGRGRIPLRGGTNALAAVERARLRLEAMREANLHEREMCRLQLEARRVRVDERYIGVLNRVADVAEKLLDVLLQ